MKLKFNVKSLGKKRPYLDQLSIEVAVESECTVQQLLSAIVAQQVDAFNERNGQKNLCAFLSEGQIEEASTTGSVRFGEIYNDKEADKERAIQTVLTAFEDGLIALFVNDTQLEQIDETCRLTELDEITMIRLTFLAGSFW